MGAASGAHADGSYWPRAGVQEAVQQLADRPNGPDNVGRTAEIVAILGEIKEINRNHRRQEEELRQERHALASMETKLRADRAEISEARRLLEAERSELGAARSALATHAEAEQAAKDTESATAELKSELVQERRNTEAQRRAGEAMQGLYTRMIEEKDQELRDQSERAKHRDRQQEARIRELTQRLQQREAAATAAVTPFSTTMEAPQELGASMAVEPTQPQAASDARRRLSYSADYSAPLFAAQEQPVFSGLLQLDASQVRTSDALVPSAPPSTEGRPLVMTSDARRRLSYSVAAGIVGGHSPETPTFEPTLSPIAQRLFDSHLEVSFHENNGTMETSEPFVGALTETVSRVHSRDEEPQQTEVTPTAQVMEPVMNIESVPAPLPPSPVPAPMVHLPPLVFPTFPVDQDESSPATVPQATEPETQQVIVAAPVAEASEPDSATSMAPCSTATATGSAKPAAVATAKAAPHGATAKSKSSGNPLLRQKGLSTTSSQRPSSARPSDRSPRSPLNVDFRRSESARLAASTPPRVQKESPPRGGVAAKVKLFEQRGATPTPQANQTSVAPNTAPHRNSGAAPPEALRRGPCGVSVPTPTGAGAPTGAARHWRAEAEEHPRSSCPRSPGVPVAC